jgi:hypothetical protein
VFADVDAALDRAYARLDYLAEDPARNARNGVRVLLKFVLLERQRIALDAIPALLKGMDVLREANARWLRMTPQEMADWAVAQLVRGGAARVEQGILLDA